MIFHTEHEEFWTDKDQAWLDSQPPVDVWWDKMQERSRRSNEKWAKKKAAERAKGIYK